MYYCTSQVRGDVCYLAPEALRDERHITTSADMWSLGAVISFIANDREHLFKTVEDVFRWRGDQSPMRRRFKHPELHHLVRDLLSIDKRNRPSAMQVLEEQDERRQMRITYMDVFLHYSRSGRGHLSVSQLCLPSHPTPLSSNN